MTFYAVSAFLGLLDPDSNQNLAVIYAEPLKESLSSRRDSLQSFEQTQLRMHQRLFAKEISFFNSKTEIEGNTMQRLIASKEYLASYQSILRGVPHRWPVRTSGRVVTSGYGKRKDPFHGKTSFHGGIDLRARNGVPILAAGYGTVLRSGRYGGLGKMVEVLHPTGYRTIYAHMSELKIKTGAWVDPGTVLGNSGSTGYAKGAHLHYEVRLDGKRINPYRFLPVQNHYRFE